MWKYYVLLFLVLGLALSYAYLADPCHSKMRTEFSNEYPTYKILESGAEAGSPESVRCRISYQKPGSEQIHEEIWLYQNPGDGWTFSRILETPEQERLGQ